MFRLTAGIYKDTRLLRDTYIEKPEEDTRTHKVFGALDEIVRQFDLGSPLWLDKNIKEFRRHASTRFTQDNFVEEIDFDYLEIRVIEED